MKAEKSGLLANGYQGRNGGHHFGGIGGTRLLEQKLQIRENAVGTMKLDRPPGCGIDTCEPQVLAVRTGKIKLTALSKGHYPGVTIPNDTLPGLNSIGFWDGVGRQDWGLDVHRNEGIEIHFVETGKMAFRTGERRFDLRPGDFTITRPWQLHKLGDPNIGPGRVHWLIIDVGARSLNDEWRWPNWVTLTKKDLLEFSNKLRHNKTPVWKSTPEMIRIFQQIALCITEWNKPHCVSRLVANLNQLFVSVLEITTTQQLVESPGKASSRRAVENFLKNLEVDQAICRDIKALEDMAKGCAMGVTSFTKYTRELVNASPMEFLKQCRLNHAARQLRQRPDISITEVCFSNGFNSSQYFATCFRKQFKMSPREFVSKQRIQRDLPSAVPEAEE
jgi:AraC-like DNA-binding protein/mannose-6-phosphate isomerase-like protein (cupin superfamily)